MSVKKCLIPADQFCPDYSLPDLSLHFLVQTISTRTKKHQHDMNWLWTTSKAEQPLPECYLEVYLNSRPETSVNNDTFRTRHARSADLVAKQGPTHALVRVLYVSVEPAMRGWLSTRPSYVKPVGIGEVMRALGVGIVIRAPSSRPSLQNALVSGNFGWTEYGLMEMSKLRPCRVPRGVSATQVLGSLGTTGMTAYFGLIHIGELSMNKVVVVSAAAGATGSIAAQIAKHVYNCYVIGIAGGKTKCEYLTDQLGLDAAIDYKDMNIPVDVALKKALNEKKIDLYFDNVGGQILEAVLRRLAKGARIVVCGGISQYNAKVPPPGPRNYLQLIAARARMEGFLLYDYEHKFDVAFKDLCKWTLQGKIKAREDQVDGLEQASVALQRLFEGKNIGKVIVKVAEDAERLTGKNCAKL